MKKQQFSEEPNTIEIEDDPFDINLVESNFKPAWASEKYPEKSRIPPTAVK